MTTNLTDSFHFLSNLSKRKLINMWHLRQSFLKSYRLKKPEIKGLPMSISVEPTTSCNLRCPECPSGLRSFSRDTGHIKSAFFRKLIDENYMHLAYLMFYFQGEPYIHPEFLEMVDYASERDIYTCTSTNAHFLNEKNSYKTIRSGLKRLIISIDGVTQETYESYRREGNLNLVIENTKRLVRIKKQLKSSTPHIVFQFLVVRPNEHEIPAMRKLARQIGVDELKFKSAQLYDFQNGHELMPLNHKFSRYRQLKNKTFVAKHSMSNRCWKMWHSCVVTWDGKVVPCCFDKDAKHVMGDLHQESLPDIWTNDAYQAFRHQILKARQEIDICTNCTEGSSPWI